MLSFKPTFSLSTFIKRLFSSSSLSASPITWWQIDGETVETVADFIFLGSKITADGDCSYEVKRCLLLGRKVMTNLDSILKSIDITLLTKIYVVKDMIFHVQMWKLDYKEIWAPKNWWFWTVVMEKIPESSWEIKPVNPKGNQLWLFVRRIDAEEQTHWKRPWCWERVRASGEGDDRGWDVWMVSSTQRPWAWANCGIVKDRDAEVHSIEKSQALLSNWTTTNGKELKRLHLRHW